MTIIGQRTCRGCGCTDSRACPGGCSWVLLDVETPTGICSQCAEEMGWDPEILAYAVCEAAGHLLLAHQPVGRPIITRYGT